MVEKIKKQKTEEHYAKVISQNLPISTKHCIEIASFIRFKNLKKAKFLLEQVIIKKMAVPMKRFNRDTGHKPGIASGRYPVKACEHILKLLDVIEANAEYKGLNTDNLKISKIISNQGSGIWHHGRKRRRRMKRSHVEIEVEEIQK